MKSRHIILLYITCHYIIYYMYIIYISEGYSFSVSICNEQRLDILDYTCVCCVAKHNMIYIPRVLFVKTHNSATD